jgi:predicted ribosome quality control (RQC) complex YloA/Tae2 family protein
MRRGESLVYPEPEGFVETKRYNSPFDVQLTKAAVPSEIREIGLGNDDKILCFDLEKAGKYKSRRCRLVFEFTGKFTNMAILDETGIVIEALRHIDASVSSREIKPGLPYVYPPKNDLKLHPEEAVEDIDAYLGGEYAKRVGLELVGLKRQYLARLEKKIKRLHKTFDALESVESLRAKSASLYAKANLLMANRHAIPPYATSLTLKDYDGKEVKVQLESAGNVNQTIDATFKQAKKTAKKAENIHKEIESLGGKIDFLRRFCDVVAQTKSKQALQMLFPKQPKSKEAQTIEHYETFLIKGYRVLLGKNERGNVELLKNARAGDIWMHLKERPSCHVIIPTNKQEVPEAVLTEAAKLCAAFSAEFGGNYAVDYTPRRNVKIKSGANVEYKFYKTLHISI